jgi:hypothetical protein
MIAGYILVALALSLGTLVAIMTGTLTHTIPVPGVSGVLTILSFFVTSAAGVYVAMLVSEPAKT